jgi:hypothetical protein
MGTKSTDFTELKQRGMGWNILGSATVNLVILVLFPVIEFRDFS